MQEPGFQSSRLAAARKGLPGLPEVKSKCFHVLVMTAASRGLPPVPVQAVRGLRNSDRTRWRACFLLYHDQQFHAPSVVKCCSGEAPRLLVSTPAATAAFL